MSGSPDLRSYDIILLNTSGGKDSQTMMRVVVEAARRAGVLDRCVAVHADLGRRVEWPGTLELARQQAEHYGLRFEVVERTLGDLLDHAEKLGKFPGYSTRWCTSDHKTAQVKKVMTLLVRELGLRPANQPGGRQARILNCMGLRAQESSEREKLQPFYWNKHASNLTVRDTWNWLPIHGWSEDQVWADIRASGVPHHYAYDLGMPRLSCMFCIYAGKDALMLAAKHNPAAAAEYVRVETKIGFRFKPDLSMAEVVRDAAHAEVTSVADWAA